MKPPPVELCLCFRDIRKQNVRVTHRRAKLLIDIQHGLISVNAGNAGQNRAVLLHPVEIRQTIESELLGLALGQMMLGCFTTILTQIMTNT